MVNSKRSLKQGELTIAIVFVIVIVVSMLGLLKSVQLLAEFNYNGESYKKGYGHILSENFDEGIRFLFIRNLSLALIACFSAVLFFVNNKRKVRNTVNFIALGIILIVAAFLLSKFYDIHYNGWDGINRTIEMGIMWVCWAPSYFLAFVSVRLILKK